MMLTPDQQRVKQLLSETITLLCKNGLHFQSEFTVNALIGITLDQQDVFLVTINETVLSGETFVRNRQRQPFSSSDHQHRSTRLPDGRPNTNPSSRLSFESKIGNRSSSDNRSGHPQSESRSGHASSDMRSGHASSDNRSGHGSNESKLDYDDDGKSGNSGDYRSSSQHSHAVSADVAPNIPGELSHRDSSRSSETIPSDNRVAKQTEKSDEVVSENNSDTMPLDHPVTSSADGAFAVIERILPSEEDVTVKSENSRKSRSSPDVANKEKNSNDNDETRYNDRRIDDGDSRYRDSRLASKDDAASNDSTDVLKADEANRSSPFSPGDSEQRAEPSNKRFRASEELRTATSGNDRRASRNRMDEDDSENDDDDGLMVIKEEPPNFGDEYPAYRSGHGGFTPIRRGSSPDRRDRRYPEDVGKVRGMDHSSGGLSYLHQASGGAPSYPGSPYSMAAYNRQSSQIASNAAAAALSSGKRSHDLSRSSLPGGMYGGSGGNGGGGGGGENIQIKGHYNVIDDMDSIVHGLGPSSSSSLQDQFFDSRDSSMGGGGGGLGGGALDDMGAWSSQRNLDTQWSNRRQRATFTSYQIDRLEATFSRSRYVGTADRAELSKQLNINENIIQVWFQNRRQKLKKQLTTSTSGTGSDGGGGGGGGGGHKLEYDDRGYNLTPHVSPGASGGQGYTPPTRSGGGGQSLNGGDYSD